MPMEALYHQYYIYNVQCNDQELSIVMITIKVKSKYFPNGFVYGGDVSF